MGGRSQEISSEICPDFVRSDVLHDRRFSRIDPHACRISTGQGRHEPKVERKQEVRQHSGSRLQTAPELQRRTLQLIEGPTKQPPSTLTPIEQLNQTFPFYFQSESIIATTGLVHHERTAGKRTNDFTKTRDKHEFSRQYQSQQPRLPHGVCGRCRWLPRPQCCCDGCRSSFPARG